MKKSIIIALFITALMSSCTQQDTPESIKKQIADHKSEIHLLSNQLTEMQSKLDLLDTTSQNTKNGIGVKVEKVKKQAFAHYFMAAGELETIHEAFVSPEISGQIVSISVKEGQYVKEGQQMAKLNTSLIEKNIEEVKTQLKLAETIYNRQKELWDKNIGSELQYLEAETNYQSLENKLNTLRVQYDMMIINAPISGVVEEVFLKEGEMAMPGMQLFQLVNLDNLYVSAKLSEAYLSAVKKGDMVVIEFPSYPGYKLERPVSRLGNVINKQNRTFILQVKIQNNDGLLKPNMLANVSINDYNSDNSIVVPSILIREDLTGKYLYVAQNNGGNWFARKKYVKEGIAYEDKSEVISGLEEGELVIVVGYNNVSDGLELNLSR